MDIVNYRNTDYYFISDIQELNKTYVYRLLKQGKLKALDKEGIKLITKESYDAYMLSRQKKVNPKTELIKKIKNLDENKLKEIQDIINKI